VSSIIVTLGLDPKPTLRAVRLVLSACGPTL
jgi:hypothetical protein